jgi:hypothetical protein
VVRRGRILEVGTVALVVLLTKCSVREPALIGNVQSSREIEPNKPLLASNCLTSVKVSRISCSRIVTIHEIVHLDELKEQCEVQASRPVTTSINSIVVFRYLDIAGSNAISLRTPSNPDNELNPQNRLNVRPQAHRLRSPIKAASVFGLQLALQW